MSGAAVGWAKRVTAPSRTAKAVLVCLADYADADGCAWPKVKRLAAEVQCSESTVQRAMRQLEAAGLVRREDASRSDGGQTSNRYFLALPRSQNDTPPVAECDPPVAPARPPIEEPLTEPSLSDESETRASRRKPQRAIPASFPTAEDLVAGQREIDKANANLDLALQAERFRNHAESKDRRCADWTAAFRNWVKGSVETAPKRIVLASTKPAADPWPRRMTDWLEHRIWDFDWGPRPGSPGCLVPPQHLMRAAS